jgi:hypothetical protein
VAVTGREYLMRWETFVVVVAIIWMLIVLGAFSYFATR